MAKTYQITEATKRKIENVIAKVNSLQGPGITNLPRTLHIRIPQVQRASSPPPPSKFYHAKITALGSSATTYKATQVRPDGSAITGALVWDAATGNLPQINLLAGGCGPAINAIMVVRPGVDSAGATYWWFENHRPFWAQITGNASLATNRWKYAWSEVAPSADTTAAVSGGRSGTTTSGYATNLDEMFHTSTYAFGVDITGTDYAASSFAPRPVGGGGTATTHRYNFPIRMYEEVDGAGTRKYYFSASGSHDGNCT